MWLLKQNAFVFLLLLLCYHGVSCKKSSIKRREKTPSQNEMAGINHQTSTISIENQDESSTLHEGTTEHHEHKHKLVHTLENAPLPCMHEGQPHLKIATRSVPMETADEHDAHKHKFEHALENSPLPCMHAGEKSNLDMEPHSNHTTPKDSKQEPKDSTFSIDDQRDETIRHEHHSPQHKLEHRLETAPLPCMHERPQPLKMEQRSAPMALESKYKDMPEQQEQKDQGNQPSFESSPNPQRPNASKLTSNANDTNSDTGDDGKPRHFHHPGHSQSSNNYPSENYNYYGIHSAYGDRYPYNSQQAFSGSTSNIGAIPPKNQNARDYYNRVSGFSDTPIVAKQGGLFSQLFGGKTNERYSTIRYGMGGFGFGGNGYKNVLAGIFLWNLMNGYSTLRYDVYHFYNFPEWMVRDLSISYESVIKCPEKSNMMCNNTQPLCTKENSIFCVTKDVVPCPNHENTCVETNLPFYDTKVESNGSVMMSLPCIANITLTGDDKPSNFELSADMLDRPLCVSIVAVPQKPCNIQSQSGDETDCPIKQMATSTEKSIN